MLNLVTFEQLFHSFLGHLEMQVNYVKTLPRRNRAKYVYTHTCKKKDIICFSIDISYFIQLLTVLFINT